MGVFLSATFLWSSALDLTCTVGYVVPWYDWHTRNMLGWMHCRWCVKKSIWQVEKAMQTSDGMDQASESILP